MKAQLWVLAIVMTLSAMLASRTAYAATSEEAEIRAAVERFDAAFNAHKTDDFLALYSTDADSIYFEEVLPLQISGRDAFRKYVDTIFTQTLNLHQVTTVEKVIAEGDLAAAVCMVRASWTEKSGNISQVGRFTMIFEKLDGKWLIWHEHFSVPYDPATSKAVFDAKP